MADSAASAAEIQALKDELAKAHQTIAAAKRSQELSMAAQKVEGYL